jgi:hypothetical protein
MKSVSVLLTSMAAILKWLLSIEDLQTSPAPLLEFQVLRQPGLSTTRQLHSQKVQALQIPNSILNYGDFWERGE